MHLDIQQKFETNQCKVQTVSDQSPVHETKKLEQHTLDSQTKGVYKEDRKNKTSTTTKLRTERRLRKEKQRKTHTESQTQKLSGEPKNRKGNEGKRSTLNSSEQQNIKPKWVMLHVQSNHSSQQNGELFTRITLTYNIQAFVSHSPVQKHLPVSLPAHFPFNVLIGRSRVPCEEGI